MHLLRLPLALQNGHCDQQLRRANGSWAPTRVPESPVGPLEKRYVLTISTVHVQVHNLGCPTAVNELGGWPKAYPHQIRSMEYQIPKLVLWNVVHEPTHALQTRGTYAP